MQYFATFLIKKQEEKQNKQLIDNNCGTKTRPKTVPKRNRTVQNLAQTHAKRSQTITNSIKLCTNDAALPQ